MPTFAISNRWTQRPDPDGLLYILFHSKGFANTARYKNDKVDALLDEARQTYDQEKRKKLYGEAKIKLRIYKALSAPGREAQRLFRDETRTTQANAKYGVTGNGVLIAVLDCRLF